MALLAARSHALVKGRAWQVFGLLAVLLGLTLVASVFIVEVLRVLGARRKDPV